jgi:hypothetical protein
MIYDGNIEKNQNIILFTMTQWNKCLWKNFYISAEFRSFHPYFAILIDIWLTNIVLHFFCSIPQILHYIANTKYK